jgi:hypothetical protein
MMKHPLIIYLLVLVSMFIVLLGLDWLLGKPPIEIIEYSFIPFFRYVDKVEYAVTILVFIYPFTTFIWSKWMKKKQNV